MYSLSFSLEKSFLDRFSVNIYICSQYECIKLISWINNFDKDTHLYNFVIAFDLERFRSKLVRWIERTRCFIEEENDLGPRENVMR